MSGTVYWIKRSQDAQNTRKRFLTPLFSSADGNATAQRNFVNDGNAANRDAAYAAVTAAKATSKRDSAHAYTVAEAGADGFWRQDKGSTKSVLETALANATKAFVAAASHADQVLDAGEAVAAAVRSSAVFTATTVYRVAESSGLSTSVHALATSDPSPWSDYDDALFSAIYDRDSTILTAERDRNIASANSIRDLAVSQTLAWEALEVAKGVTLGDFQILKASHKLQQNINQIAAHISKASVVNLPAWEDAHPAISPSWGNDSGGNPSKDKGQKSTPAPRKPDEAMQAFLKALDYAGPNSGSTTLTANGSLAPVLGYDPFAGSGARTTSGDARSRVAEPAVTWDTLNSKVVLSRYFSQATLAGVDPRLAEYFRFQIFLSRFAGDNWLEAEIPVVPEEELARLAYQDVMGNRQGPLTPAEQAKIDARIAVLRNQLWYLTRDYTKARNAEAQRLKLANEYKRPTPGNKVEQLEDAILMAKLSQAAYLGEDQTGVNALGWFALPKGEFNDEKSGFQAVAFKHQATGEVVLAFAGTNPKEGPDLWTNGLQGVGISTEQYRMAIELTEYYKREFPGKLRLTGHSLGGGLASAGALVHRLPAATFNGAGVHPNTLGLLGYAPSFIRDLMGSHYILSYRVRGEPLTRAQDSWNIVGFMMPDGNGKYIWLKWKTNDWTSGHLFPDIFYGLDDALKKARRDEQNK